jgi:hypothetical protein
LRRRRSRNSLRPLPAEALSRTHPRLLALCAMLTLRTAPPSSSSLAVRAPASTLSPANSPVASCAATVCSYLRAPLARAIRGLVSKNKRRFIDAATGADIDFSYVTDRIVATGYPAEGVEALYRNPAGTLRAVLRARHGLAHVRVWNLCVERGYADSLLGVAGVERDFCWYDHYPPPFRYLRPLCAAMRAWLDADPANIVCIRVSNARSVSCIPARLAHADAARNLPQPPNNPQTARLARAERAPS